MSSDFDKDNDGLDNGDESQNQPDDEGAFDWLDSEPDSQPDEDDQAESFDWEQAAPPGEQRRASTGLTGELPWLQGKEEPPSWLKGALEEPEQEEPVTGDEIPDWLKQAGGEFEEQPEEPAEAVPDWLQQAAPESEEQPEEPGEAVPDWLQQQPTIDTSQPVEDVDDLASAVPDWLQQQPAFDESQPVEEAADLESTVPDWLQSSEEPSAPEEMLSTPPAAELPPWMAGIMAEESAGELPDMAAELPDLEADIPVTFDDMDFDEILADVGEGAGEELPDMAALTEDEGPSMAELMGGVEETLDFGEQETFDDELAFDELFEGGEEAAPARLDTGYLREMGLGEPKPSQPQAEELPIGDSDVSWLEELDQLEPQPVEDASLTPLVSQAIPDEADFLAAPEEVFTPLFTPTAREGEELTSDDIDRFLSSFDESEVKLPKTGELQLLPDAELDDLFKDSRLAEIAEQPEVAPEDLSPDAPEWLRGIASSVTDTSAAALVRKRPDRPLEELTDRLQTLHEQGLELPAPKTESQRPPVLAEILPDVAEVLAPAPLSAPAEPGQMAGGVLQLSREQEQNASLLAELIGEGAVVRRAGAAETVAARPAARARRRGRIQIRLERLVITALVAVGVILPFVLGRLRVGDLPPFAFASGSRQQAAFDLVDDLKPGQLVLVGIEYGPTGAPELDAATDALLHHMFIRGARPVLVGGNPIGLLHASNILKAVGAGADTPFLAQVGRSAPFQPNEDYYVIRYLTGGVVGLRTLMQNVSGLLASDYRGAATHLAVASPHDFALVVVIAENAEDVRAWAEQIVPMTSAPFVVVTGYAGAPLSEPYAKAAGAGGLLTGYRDAYTYNRMVSEMLYGPYPTPSLPPTTIAPTQPPTASPTSAPPTETVEGAALTEEATSAATTAAPTDTPTSSPSPTATASPTPTATRTPSPTPSDTPTPSPTPLPVGVVTAQQAINVRSGPGTTFAPVAALQPGDHVLVMGTNEDGTWLNVLLEDSSSGWVSASLVAIEPPPEAGSSGGDATPTPETGGLLVNPPRVFQRSGSAMNARAALRVALAQVEPTPTPTEEPEATVESARAAGGTDVTARPEIPYKDERWYGMTIGLIVIIVVIGAGNLFNIIRLVFRRRRS